MDLDLTGIGTWGVPGTWSSVGTGARGSGMHGMLSVSEKRPSAEGYALISKEGGPSGGGSSAGAGAQARVRLGHGWVSVFEGVFWSQASTTSAPSNVLASDVRVEVSGGPRSTDGLAYRPDVFSGGETYAYQGEVVMADLASFLMAASVWTPRRYSLDMSEMDAVLGDVGAAFGEVATGGFLGRADDGLDGRSVVWTLRKMPGEQRGTLVIHPSVTEAAPAEAVEAGTAYRMREVTDEAPTPWSALGDAEGAKIANDWTRAKAYAAPAGSEGAPAGTRVAAPASLKGAFSGATAATSIDLTNMDMGPARDLSSLASGCAELASVAIGAGVEASSGDDVAEGLQLTGAEGVVSLASMCEGSGAKALAISGWALSAPGVEAERAFSGMGRLDEASIEGSFNGEGLDASEMLQGSGAAGGTLAVSGSLNGADRKSVV